MPCPREWKGEFGEPVGWIRDALGFRAEEAAGEEEIGGATRNGAPISFFLRNCAGIPLAEWVSRQAQGLLSSQGQSGPLCIRTS